MSVDPYAPCPCGSGKKVKFCCQAILPEMEKVERLLENNQPRMALQILEKIQPEHPGNAWVATAQGWAFIADHRPADAKASLSQFLRKNPDHPSANALHALAAFQAEGFPASKKAIHRAFRRSFRAEPSIVTGLAASMSEELMRRGHFIASRQHYALALRYGDEEDRKQAFSAMVEIDGDAQIPYPLRGVHNVPEFRGTPETHETIQKAHRLSAAGCWEEAAELIAPVCEQQAENPEGWHTLGLFHAWDGNDNAAAEALRKAGQLSTNFELAVECETLAQLLEDVSDSAAAQTKMTSYPVESVSRLLTRLDEQTLLVRAPEAALKMAGLNEVIAAQYDIIDRPAPAGDDLANLTLANAPLAIGRVIILNEGQGPESKGPQALLSAYEGEDYTSAKKHFEEAAGDALKEGKDLPTPDRESAGWNLSDRLPLREKFFTPFEAPASVRERLDREWHTELVTKRWPEAPQKALGGKSPRDAKGVAELRVPLAAAINVLDALCDGRSRIVDVNDLRREYDLPALEMMDVPADANVNLLSLMQLRRVNLRSLSDEQFRPLLRRVLLSRHNGHAYATLREYLENRTHLHDASTRERDEVLEALIDVCRRTLRREEAINWAQHGQALAKSSERPFELLLAWKMKELMLRVEDRNDPQAKPLFDELWTHFGTKLPQLRDTLRNLAAYAGFEPPGQGVVIAETEIGGREGGFSLEPASAASGEKKLWLPGMD